MGNSVSLIESAVRLPRASYVEISMQRNGDGEPTFRLSYTSLLNTKTEISMTWSSVSVSRSRFYSLGKRGPYEYSSFMDRTVYNHFNRLLRMIGDEGGFTVLSAKKRAREIGSELRALVRDLKNPALEHGISAQSATRGRILSS